MLHELFKNRGSKLSIFNYRDVFIGSLLGKAFSRHLRSVILPFVLSLLGTHQYACSANGGELLLRTFTFVCFLIICVPLGRRDLGYFGTSSLRLRPSFVVCFMTPMLVMKNGWRD